MNNMSPLAWFGNKADAEHVRGILQEVGILATVREARNPPPGWETKQNDGFDLWVNEPEMQTAAAVYGQLPRPLIPTRSSEPASNGRRHRGARALEQASPRSTARRGCSPAGSVISLQSSQRARG